MTSSSSRKEIAVREKKTAAITTRVSRSKIFALLLAIFFLMQFFRQPMTDHRSNEQEYSSFSSPSSSPLPSGTKEESGTKSPYYLSSAMWFGMPVSDDDDEEKDGSSRERKAKATIAYATALTACRRHYVDAALVLKYSIHMSSIRGSSPNNGTTTTSSTSSRYDYRMYAFVHPDARDCVVPLQKAGYSVDVVETPVDVSSIDNKDTVRAITKTGCCGDSEFLKLYSYTLTEYPLVVYLDLDTMVTRPLDVIFDFMLPSPSENNNGTQDDVTTTTSSGRVVPHGMWSQEVDHRVDALFTRDYYSMDGRPHGVVNVGVQGGFFVLRPNQSTFDEICSVILDGQYVAGYGWGGTDVGLQYGGFHGDAQIQGLLPYYYGYHRPNTSLELNRCYFNNILEPPRFKTGVCHTGEDECQDCRDVKLSEMYTMHFTYCEKPWYCPDKDSPKLKNFWSSRHQVDVCYDAHRLWHKMRHDVETVLGVTGGKETTTAYASAYDFWGGPEYSYGHCHRWIIPTRYGMNRYVPLSAKIFGLGPFTGYF